MKQFFRTLGKYWVIDDRTFDGCHRAAVPLNGRGDLITLTICGNDLLWNREKYLREGIDDFQHKHPELLAKIRRENPRANFIVGDIYEPAMPLSNPKRRGLAAANEAIHMNCDQVQAFIAPSHDTLQSRANSYLCLAIEPTLLGAKAIAKLFEEAYRRYSFNHSSDWVGH